MSHSTKIENYVFIHDGDPTCVLIREWDNDEHIGTPTMEVTIHFDVLAEFVGRIFLSRKISTLEELSGTDFLENLKFELK